MTAEAQAWRVGIIGLNSAGLFLLERLSLATGIHVVGVVEEAPARRPFAAKFGCPIWDSPAEGITSPSTDVILFTGRVTIDLVSLALRHKKHLVIHQPWHFSSDELRRLAKLAAASNCQATIASLDRWSADFLAADAARKTGRLGVLESLRISSCETRLPLDADSPGVLPELGYSWIDQLRMLVSSEPRGVFARRYFVPNHVNSSGDAIEQGFVATIEFEGNCTAQLELQTRSRLSFRTGWMLEGSTGSYRNNRLYTTTADGEIVDEPLPLPSLSLDPFVSALTSSWQGESTRLPTLNDAARVVDVIDGLEQSAASGEVVSLQR